MDFDFARFQLTTSRREKENTAAPSPSKQAYRKLLAETLLNNRTRILAFKSKPPVPNDGFLSESSDAVSHPTKSAKRRRYISQTAERALSAPDIVDDYYLNLLDWGSSNVLSIALGNTVYLWNASEGSASELVTVDEDMGPITSVSWAPDGHHIDVGLNNSHVQLWNSCNNRLLRTLRGIHRSRVGSLSWNNNILSTGGMDGKIVNNDVRIESHAVHTYRGHTQEVCGLKWSGSGRQLASVGNDSRLHIWDISMSSSSNRPRSRNQWLHRFDDHMAAVKALAWCPFQSNLFVGFGWAVETTDVVQGMLSQMDPSLVSFCDKIAAQGGPVHVEDDLGGLSLPSVPVVQLASVTRTSARLRNVQPEVNLSQSYEALKRGKKNTESEHAGSADEERTCAVSEPESTKPSSSEPEPSREPDANGPTKRPENVQNNALQDSPELTGGQSSQETNQDSVLTDTDISEQLGTLKQRLKDRSDGYGVAQLERLYSRVLKGVMAIRSREGYKDYKLLIARHLLKFVEDDDNF